MQRAEKEKSLIDIALESHDWQQAADALMRHGQSQLPDQARLSLACAEDAGDSFRVICSFGHFSDILAEQVFTANQIHKLLESAPAGERGMYQWRQKPLWISPHDAPDWFRIGEQSSFPEESVLAPFYTATELTGFLLAENFGATALSVKNFQFLTALRNVLKLTVPKINPLIHDPEKLKKILISADKMASLGQLISGVAHELNNPISFIESNVGFLEKYLGDILRIVKIYETENDLPEHVVRKAEEYKDSIEFDFTVRDMENIIRSFQDGAFRIKSIISSLSSFSRADKRVKEEMNIHDALDNTINLLVHKARHEVEFSKAYAAKPYLVANRSEVNQVLMNILVNAVQSIQRKIGSKDKGSISVSTWSDEVSVFVAIQDNGEGIQKDHLDKIFDPFFTTKPYGEGTGLGLSISREIVERHDGTLKAESRFGEGSIFTLSFPLNLDGDK